MAPKLLSGGNPQIAKGDGNAPVHPYIAFARNVKVSFFRGALLDPLPGWEP